ncbi:transposable element Tcb2 transposase [Trichonephila clavipes]|nr:transposable element Tcb2 transposase [Trichonephila clavipes]
MEAGWSARRVARHLGRSDCVVMRCRDQWMREGHLHEDQAQDALDRPVAEKTIPPSLGSPVSFRTIRKRQAEGHLLSRSPLCVLPLMPTHRRLRLEWCCIRGNWTAVDLNQVILAMNPDSKSQQ